MVTRYSVSLEKPRPVRGEVARSTVAMGAILAFAVLALAALAPCFGGMIARADSPGNQRQPQTAGVQRPAQIPPPIRVILPAPWEPATPVQPAAPAGSADRK